jgi:hypothetical protein
MGAAVTAVPSRHLDTPLFKSKENFLLKPPTKPPWIYAFFSRVGHMFFYKSITVQRTIIAMTDSD